MSVEVIDGNISLYTVSTSSLEILHQNVSVILSLIILSSKDQEFLLRYLYFMTMAINMNNINFIKYLCHNKCLVYMSVPRAHVK